LNPHYDSNDFGDGCSLIDYEPDSSEPSHVPDANDKGDWVLGRNTAHTLP
jgi:hypothetical protein